jgi:DNA modification methylase
MQIRKVPIGKVNPAPYNPRKDLKPDDKEYRLLVKSLDEYGCIQPLVWNKRTGHLVGGHQRFKVLLAQGARQVEVSVVDLPLEKEKALNLALNQIRGQWDDRKLAQLLDDLIKLPELDIETTGFVLPDAEQLIASFLTDDDPDDQVDPSGEDGGPRVTQPGDLIELGVHGEHRILCGDVTRSSDVARLMADSRARLCHTDPPYGVSYDRGNRPAAKKTRSSQDLIRNDDLTPKRYAAWFGKVAAGLAEALVPGAPFYIWNSRKNFGLMHDLLTGHHFKVASVITWVKESFSPGFGDYNEQVEYCLYGWKSGARHRWYGPKNETTCWQVRRDQTHLYRHPTQKPLELAERAIRNSSARGDIVFDPFLGSGTTLVAAARLGRRCLGLEIEPRYCDVIVRRYVAAAGKKAVSREITERYCPQEVAV